MSENVNFYFPPYIPIFLAGIKIGYLLVTLCQGNALIPFWKHRSCAVLGKRSLHYDAIWQNLVWSQFDDILNTCLNFWVFFAHCPRNSFSSRSLGTVQILCKHNLGDFLKQKIAIHVKIYPPPFKTTLPPKNDT